MTTVQIGVLGLATIGVFLLLVSAIGILRMRGVHARMQASGVGGTLGIMIVLFSAGIYYYQSQELWRMLVLIALFAITGPIATTAMARAAYRRSGHRIRQFIEHDDMADPNYTPDYQASDAIAREPVVGQ
jgi:monovalent cation/proton antiporter MnhG/PhaG subunit